MGRDFSFAGIASDASPCPVIAGAPILAPLPLRSKKPLHVLTLTPFYPVADDDAQGCFVAEPLPELERHGITHTVIAARPFYYRRARALASAPRADWAHYVSVPGNPGLPSAGAFLFANILRKIRRLHQARPLDLIHAHSPLPCGHAAALLSRELAIPYMVTVHGLDAFFAEQAGYAALWCKRVCRTVYRSARCVICISEKVRDQVQEGANRLVNTAVIYNGVDAQAFLPARDSGDAPRILSVGNLIPIKGHELLLRAMAAIRDRIPDVTCDIIGDGKERSRLESLAGELGIRDRVRFLGRQGRPQVADAMRECTVFALPSRYEGLGCVYLEAMSTGKPVIACQGQGISEVIQHGVNGWLACPDDVNDLADALSLLLQSAHLRQQLGRAARHTVLRGLTLAHQAEHLAAVYRECVA